MQISENRLKYCIDAFYGTFKAAVCKFCLFVAISVWKPEIAAAGGIIFLLNIYFHLNK